MALHWSAADIEKARDAIIRLRQDILNHRQQLSAYNKGLPSSKEQLYTAYGIVAHLLGLVNEKQLGMLSDVVHELSTKKSPITKEDVVEAVTSHFKSDKPKRKEQIHAYVDSNWEQFNFPAEWQSQAKFDPKTQQVLCFFVGMRYLCPLPSSTIKPETYTELFCSSGAPPHVYAENLCWYLAAAPPELHLLRAHPFSPKTMFRHRGYRELLGMLLLTSLQQPAKVFLSGKPELKNYLAQTFNDESGLTEGGLAAIRGLNTIFPIIGIYRDIVVQEGVWNPLTVDKLHLLQKYGPRFAMALFSLAFPAGTLATTVVWGYQLVRAVFDVIAIDQRREHAMILATRLEHHTVSDLPLKCECLTRQDFEAINRQVSVEDDPTKFFKTPEDAVKEFDRLVFGDGVNERIPKAFLTQPFFFRAAIKVTQARLKRESAIFRNKSGQVETDKWRRCAKALLYVVGDMGLQVARAWVQAYFTNEAAIWFWAAVTEFARMKHRDAHNANHLRLDTEIADQAFLSHYATQEKSNPALISSTALATALAIFGVTTCMKPHTFGDGFDDEREKEWLRFLALQMPVLEEKERKAGFKSNGTGSEVEDGGASGSAQPGLPILDLGPYYAELKKQGVNLLPPSSKMMAQPPPVRRLPPRQSDAPANVSQASDQQQQQQQQQPVAVVNVVQQPPPPAVQPQQQQPQAAPQRVAPLITPNTRTFYCVTTVRDTAGVRDFFAHSTSLPINVAVQRWNNISQNAYLKPVKGSHLVTYKNLATLTAELPRR